jgi:chromosomal replication initiator protein
MISRVQSTLASSVGSARYDLWLARQTQWSFDQRTLTLRFTSEFAQQLCQKMLGKEIAAALLEVSGDNRCQIQYQVCADDQRCSEQCTDHQSASTFVDSQPEATIPISKTTQSGQCEARSSETRASVAGQSEPASTETGQTIDLWSQIVPGQSNQMACAALNLISAEPGKMTPLVIHGPTGTGKSMMLAALAQRLRLVNRLRRVVWMTSEQFTNDFTEALRGGGLPMFRRKYRDVDALLLDDFQFFAGKRSTMAEVRHTIDNLLRAGKQVVVSVDRSLGELDGLGEELQGRLRSGLVAPVLSLDRGIRANLLTQLTQNAGVPVQAEAIEQLADRIPGDGRLIRGVVHRLLAVSSVSPGILDWERCWNALYDLIQSAQPVVRMSDIERAVCGLFGLNQDCLQSKSKMRSISQPRMLAMFLARKYTPAAYNEIGLYFGRRRHSTVISAEKTVEAWLQENAKMDGIRQMTVRDVIRHVESQLQVG